MTSEIRTNSLKSRAGLSTVTLTDSGPMFSGITTFVDNSGFNIGTGSSIFSPATNTLTFGTNSNERLRISSGGGVYIGNTGNSFNSVLGVHKAASNAQSFIVITNNSTGTTTNDGFVVGLNGSQEALLFNKESTPMRFATAGVEKLRITSAGKVGINTVSPTYGMHLHGTTASSNAYYYAEQSTAGASAGFRLKTTGSHFSIYGATSGSALGIYDYNAGAERLTITSTGEIKQYGFTGSSDASADDLVLGNTTGGVNRGMTIWSNSSQNGSIAFADNDSNFRGAVQYIHNGDSLRFLTAGSERLRIDSNGKLILGTEIVNAGNANANISLFISGSRSGAYGGATTNAIIFDNQTAAVDAGGSLTLAGYSGSQAIAKALIRGGNEGSASTQSGYFAVFTRPSSGNLTERLRIRSDGDTTISASTSANFFPNAALDIVSDKNVNSGLDDKVNYHLALANPNNDTNEAIGIAFGITDTSTKVGAAIVHQRDAAGSQGHLKFFTRPSNAGPPLERVRIRADGNFYVNSSNNSIVGQPSFYASNNDGCGSYRPHSGFPIHHFYSNAGGTFSLESYVNGDGSYVNLSDYRLKENIVSISNGIDIVKQLNPVKFDWKSSSKTKNDLGFIAHEVQTLIPTAVDGTKDQMKEDGSPFYQGIAQTKIIPYLTAALKEAITKIEKLEQDNIALRVRVTNLEGN